MLENKSICSMIFLVTVECLWYMGYNKRKYVFRHMRTANAQISHMAWSRPSMDANRIIGYHRMYGEQRPRWYFTHVLDDLKLTISLDTADILKQRIGYHVFFSDFYYCFVKYDMIFIFESKFFLRNNSVSDDDDDEFMFVHLFHHYWSYWDK